MLILLFVNSETLGLVVSCVIFACHDGYLSIGCIYLYSMWTNNVQPKRFTASFIKFV